MPGSIVLVAGDPGIGKSTLILQMAIEMAAAQRVLYVSGEEFRAADPDARRPAGCLKPGLTARAAARDRDQPGGDPEPCGRGEARPVDRGFHPDHVPSGHGFIRWLRLAGARMRLPVARAGQGQRRDGLPHRARHQGRRHCGAPSAGAYCGYRAVPGGRSLPSLPPTALRQEPLWGHVGSRSV